MIHTIAQTHKRKIRDVTKLLMSDYKVKQETEDQFEITLLGPKNTPYESGEWRVSIDLPEEYPFKSPSIGF